MAKGLSETQWASALLGRLGIPESKGALQAVVGWERAEGGHFHNDARFNPLNTTMPAKGAGNTGTQGNIKVYKSWQQGLDATVRTLKNGLYGGILQALKSGKPNVVGQAIEKSPWGTGGLAAKVIGQTKIGAVPKAPAGALLSAAEGSTPVSSSRSSDNMGGGADALSLLQSLQASSRQPRATAGIPAPAFSAQPAMPAGAMIPQGGMSPAPQPDLKQLLASITTPGGDVAKTTVTGGDPVAGPPAGRDAPAASAAGGKTKGTLGQLIGHPLDRPGAPTHPAIIKFAQRVAGVLHSPIQVGTGTQHNQFVKDSNRVSAHWSGNALDLPAAGARLTHMGHAALIAAGMDPAQARKQKGGVFNVGGYQILFNTNEGGNHFNHLHVGIRG